MSGHVTHTIFVKYTDAKGGVTRVSHEVWDGPLFMETRKAEAALAGGKSAVEQITKEQYLAAR